MLHCRQAKDRFVRLKKERDYHRMNHRRVLQEKERLVGDLRRMQEHVSQREDAVVKMKAKYEVGRLLEGKGGGVCDRWASAWPLQATLREKTLLEIGAKKRKPVQPGSSGGQVGLDEASVAGSSARGCLPAPCRTLAQHQCEWSLSLHRTRKSHWRSRAAARRARPGQQRRHQHALVLLRVGGCSSAVVRPQAARWVLHCVLVLCVCLEH